jgi:hypothetical protein
VLKSFDMCTHMLFQCIHEFQYYQFSGTVHDITRFRVENMFAAFKGMGETFTASALSSNSTFPFVTPEMVEVEGHHVRAQSGVEMIMYAPYVSGDQKEKWETYSVNNQKWLKESRVSHGNGHIWAVFVACYGRNSHMIHF